MSDALSVSVVVPVLDGAATIGDLLAALAAQSPRPAGTEVIVVDNGSTDGTPDIVRAADVTLLHEEKPGPSAARNRGLHHARGEVIVHTDADALPTRRWLTELLAAFADPSVVLAGGQVLSYPPATGPERYMAGAGMYDTEFAVNRPVFPFVPGLTLAVRRDAAVAVGGWAEDLRAAEDVDFCFRVVRDHPGQIVYRPGAVVFHRNRNTDAALREQARVWGAGVAGLYRRYPDEVRWTWRNTADVAGRLAGRTARPVLLRLGRLAGRGSDDQVEFARYHRLWAWSYWRGFYEAYR